MTPHAPSTNGARGSRFVSRRVGALLGGRLERWGMDAISAVQLWALRTHKSHDVVDLIRTTRRDRAALMFATEAFLLHSVARAQSRLDGAFAEVGVFQGASARLLCEVKGDKPLHLFDTFDGLPTASTHDERRFARGMYACSQQSVERYLGGYRNVVFHPGVFPDSTRDLPETHYAFVHLDVDLYEPMLACLQYFHPRLVPGGIIVAHDYSVLTGVRAAFDDYFRDEPESVIELPSTQCMTIRRA